MRGQLVGHPRLERDFVVYLQELGDGGVETVRRCVGARRFRALFPAQDAAEVERRRVAALPVDERVRHLVSLLGTFTGPIMDAEAQESLVDIGAPAVPDLRHLLADPGRGWMAAMLLGRIGDSGPETITALRARFADAPDSNRGWIASTLARLGDVSWLEKRIDDAEAVAGIAGLYTGFRDETPAVLDYGPLARLLDGPAEVRTAVEAALKLGAFCTLRPSEIDTALAALHSPHQLIRRHAAWLLGQSELGTAAGRRVLPALAHTLRTDPAARVRWTALFSLRHWKRAARPHRAAVVAALHDVDPGVRELATQLLADHAGKDGPIISAPDTGT
jgi:HEAT repeat protein